MEKQETIAGTMAAFMATSPAVEDFPSYKALNDFVGNLHGLEKGKCQALAGAKAWRWTPDTVTGFWRESTPEEFADRQTAAATKNHGGPRSKVLSDADRAALEAQVEALEAANKPALAPLLAEKRAELASDDVARRGSLKDRLAAAIDKLGLERAVAVLEWQIAAVKNAAAENAAAENAAAENA